MIHIFFVPGMFGTTIEYVLRNYTKEYEKINISILSDGSMHSFAKEYHPRNIDEINSNIHLNSKSIATPIYPFKNQHLDDILKIYQIESSDRCVLLHALNVESAELNLLFQYHKIADGLKVKLGLDIFCGNNNHNITSWNKSYSSWKDMQPWELREWFSIFYTDWVQEWVNSPTFVPSNWKIVSNIDVVNFPLDSFRQIIDFCGLTEDCGLENFSIKWKAAQQYIIDEFDLLDQIVYHTIAQEKFNWTAINIIAESIVQQRLRSKGYEIMCDGLNTFPTSSQDLYKLLIKV
jgi:hypothetical protein